MKKNVFAPLLLIIFTAAGTFSCDMNYDQDDSMNKILPMGMGCMNDMPITMKSTTYNMDNQIISASQQVVLNMTVQDSQPNMTSMYEMYAGVQLELDFSGFKIVTFIQNYLKDPDSAMDSMMSFVKQNPLLTQFWALNKMASSVDAGDDDLWMTTNDTIDPIYGYFVTTNDGDRYRQITFSDFGVTPSGRTDFIVENSRKIKTYTYEAGSDDDFGTGDDELVKTTVYQYNSAGKMERAINYSDDGVTFENVYVFTYDENGRLLSMYSYEDEAGTNRLAWGSYSKCTWAETDGIKTLNITLGLRLDFGLLGGEFDISAIKFHYEFNEDGTIHKMIQYKPMSNNIDTCYVYVYSGSGFLSMGNMNDESNNYSDDGITQKSHTVNELILGGD
ncbi:MAG: hypothetical protein A2176_02280 [Spirochaetes bacterium RBG_13_51_14]|nr:MAG: hypothetical protein A2176_02280 [Spirochaetes bacterium RBG_13_51_14]